MMMNAALMVSLSTIVVISNVHDLSPILLRCIFLLIMRLSLSPSSSLTLSSIVTYLQGDSLQNLSNGLDTVSYRMPLGVCAGIGK